MMRQGLGHTRTVFSHLDCCAGVWPAGRLCWLQPLSVSPVMVCVMMWLFPRSAVDVKTMAELERSNHQGPPEFPGERIRQRHTYSCEQ